METIYKYPIKITDVQEIMAKPGKVIHAGFDPRGVPCVWIQVCSTMQDSFRKFYVIGTGNPVPPEARFHCGSFVQGPFVWHVYHE